MFVKGNGTADERIGDLDMDKRGVNKLTRASGWEEKEASSHHNNEHANSTHGRAGGQEPISKQTQEVLGMQQTLALTQEEASHSTIAVGYNSPPQNYEDYGASFQADRTYAEYYEVMLKYEMEPELESGFESGMSSPKSQWTLQLPLGAGKVWKKKAQDSGIGNVKASRSLEQAQPVPKMVVMIHAALLHYKVGTMGEDDYRGILW
ncbi:hypothetical protein BGX38DRAFT_1268802 [Terfezia claveryi]|nr:hypothetical protein BGX38DRAFT_1268802 [Terfezia claveryi]